jgi:hypothetical protein
MLHKFVVIEILEDRLDGSVDFLPVGNPHDRRLATKPTSLLKLPKTKVAEANRLGYAKSHFVSIDDRFSMSVHASVIPTGHSHAACVLTEH